MSSWWLFQVSVLVLKMSDVNCAIEVQGDDLSVALQVMNVVPEQLNNVGMWQFLRGYVGKTLLWDSAALLELAFTPACLGEYSINWSLSVWGGED